MNDIDNMDMLGFLTVRAWSANHKKKKAPRPKKAYIDQVWPGSKPD